MTQGKSPQKSGLGTLEPGTRQRAQLPTRIADIAWTALWVLVALWAVWASVGAVRGTTAWGYCAVAWVLLAIALTMRVLVVRRRTRI
ncbi:hypothetical protein [Streptomyces sp.]|uniref:hypothetical protein n=1 Tax=Streptomyces sp. TaxID=1931 RepID=UPI002D7126D1|nr:hypothetical protein [Streptomyces sp.]HZF87781.1 hypothetical protein [Streptomyces sp.]